MRKTTLSALSFNSIGEEPKEKKNPRKRLLYSLAKACGILAAVNAVALLVFTGVGVGLGVGIKTIAPKLYGGTCTKNSDCTTISENGFICLNKTCQCSNSSYYSSYKCLTKKTYLSSCDSTVLCNQNMNLRCINSTCVCFNKMMWDGQSCAPGYYNESCNATSQCQTYNGFQCINNTCSCLNTDFYDGSKSCVLKKLYNNLCVSSNQCNEKLDLLCSNGICDCNSTLYHNGSLCVSKKDLGQVCVNNNECQDYLNPPLSCTNNTCSCPNTHYWVSSSNCVPKKLYQEACSSNIECDDNKLLSCPTKSGQCNCPTTSVANKCDCPNGYFWDYVNQECYVKKTFSETCLTNANYQCLENLGLSCTGTCSCNSKYYWDTTLNKCVCKSQSGSAKTTAYGIPVGGTTSFSVDIKDLSSMTVYSGQYVYAMVYNYLNGQKLVCGNINSASITQINTVNLVNQMVTALYMRSGSWIDAFEFQITDKTTGVSTVTPHWGGWGGGPTTLDVTTIAPNSIFFEITQFAGTFDYSFLRTWTVQSTYIQCL